jgi:hypothetical protein
MRYLKDFDYIIENMSQARKILKENDISKDNKDFKKILDKTNRDGYTGFITKLVFEMAMDVDSALKLYDDLKEQNIDIGGSKIKKILNSNVANNVKIQEIIDIIRKTKKDSEKNDFELIFKSQGFDVYKINNYEGIMCTGSPAWCLKTKSFFDQYTKTKKGTQFVLINSRLVEDDGKFKITVPNTWDGERYRKPGFESLRYGVTIYPSGRMEVFDDNNIQYLIEIKDGEVVSNKSINPFLRGAIKELYDYFMKNIKTSLPEYSSTPKNYDDFKEKVELALDYSESKRSFSDMIERTSFNIDEKYTNFLNELKNLIGVETKEDLFNEVNEYIFNMFSDDFFTSNCGILDIFLNEVASRSGEFTRLENYPNITAREIPLGGYWFDEQETGDLAIKYYYGFQYEKYGKAALLQGFGSLENFYKEMADNFYEILDDFQYTVIDAFSENYDNSAIHDAYQSSELNIKKEKCNDGYKVILDIKNWEDYKKTNKPIKDIQNELFDKLKIWFDGTKKEGNSKIIVPICSKPTEIEE